MTLDEYFEKHYGDFECECEWYVDPAPKSWKFYVPSLHVDIVLSENDGEVTELRFSKLPSDRAFRDVVVEELWDNLAVSPSTQRQKNLTNLTTSGPKEPTRKISGIGSMSITARALHIFLDLQTKWLKG